MKLAIAILVLVGIAQWSVVAADITNVTLTVTYAEGLARPANPQEVKSSWGVGLVVTAWAGEGADEKIDPTSARAETNRNELVLSYATKSVKWPDDVIPASFRLVQLEFIVRDIPHTNYVITVKRR